IAEPQILRIAESGPVGKPIEAVALADDALGKFAGQNSIRLVPGGNGTEMLFGEAAHFRVDRGDAAIQLGDTPFAIANVRSVGRGSREAIFDARTLTVASSCLRPWRSEVRRLTARSRMPSGIWSRR